MNIKEIFSVLNTLIKACSDASRTDRYENATEFFIETYNDTLNEIKKQYEVPSDICVFKPLKTNSNTDEIEFAANVLTSYLECKDIK